MDRFCADHIRVSEVFPDAVSERKLHIALWTYELFGIVYIENSCVSDRSEETVFKGDRKMIPESESDAVVVFRYDVAVVEYETASVLVIVIDVNDISGEIKKGDTINIDENFFD